MREFKHSIGNAFFNIEKSADVYHIAYDCVVEEYNQRKWLYGLRLAPVVEMYKAWCIEHKAKETDIARLFEPYSIEKPWSDLDGITIDDEEIIP